MLGFIDSTHTIELSYVKCVKEATPFLIFKMRHLIFKMRLNWTRYTTLMKTN